MSTSKSSDEKDVIHTRLSVLRAERGLSRRALAETVGVHYQTIGYVERGEYNPSLGMALRIAAVFGLPVDAVFSLAPFPPLSTQLYPSTFNQETDHE